MGGFDGMAIGEYTIPKLATVVQAVEELADRSIRILQESMEGTQPVRYETVPVTMQGKESSRKIG